MSVIRHEPRHPPLKSADLDGWAAFGTAIVSDELNRSQTMDPGLRPVRSVGSAIVGHALTVRSMVGDNLAIHHAIAEAPSGAVLVIAAGGLGPNAVWGGILHRAAELKGLVAVIVDGCIRDSAEICASPVPCYARGTVPAGPQKGWGGEINGRISAGGCVVEGGDLVLADDDGVVVVPGNEQEAVRARCEARVTAERAIIERLEAGETTVEIFDL